MNDDPQLRREDFDDCFAGEPPTVSADGDLTRGRHLLRRRRRMAGGVVAGIVAVVVLAVPLLTSLTFPPGPVDPAVPTTVRPTAPTPGPTQSTGQEGTCTGQTIKIADAITDPARRPVTDAKKVPATDENGDENLMITVGPTGEVLLEEGRRDSSENDVTTLRPGQLKIWDPETGKRTTVRGPDDLHADTQTTYAAMDEKFVVWVETPDTTVGTTTWELYAYDRATKKISKVADSTQTPSHGVGKPEAIPVLWNGTVFWPEARENPDGGDPLINIYRRDLASGGKTRVAVRNAMGPAATDGWLYFVDYQPGDKKKRGVHRTSLTGDRTELVHQDAKQEPSYPAATGEISAWSVGPELVVYRGTTLIARLVAPKGDRVTDVTAGDGTIGFISGNGGEGDPEWNYLLDLRTGCSLHRLSDNDELAAVIATGRTVAWAGPDAEGNRYTWTVGRLR
ncbi:hypothetical protein [Microlunatus sp. GCM10028923]|uniref:hypothetical protein n=1 Tax=Microlunatus sp. GCM10028923 TaxID=3273400 RepID=UPI00360F2C49